MFVSSRIMNVYLSFLFLPLDSAPLLVTFVFSPIHSDLDKGTLYGAMFFALLTNLNTFLVHSVP